MDQQDTGVARDSRGTSLSATAFLDTLRFIAANLVLLSHILLVFFDNKVTYKGRGVAVITLFVLSGFLITRSLMYRASKPGPHIAMFLADRVARIMTPYVPALVLIALLDLLLIDSNHGQGGTNTGLLSFLGNLLMLQDHAVFQAFDFVGADLSWRVRPYNSAEPFWTVAIEMWIYVSMGLFLFCVLKREKIDRLLGLALAMIALPVLIWNAAAGGGKSLSLIWLLGAIAGYLFHLWRANGYANIRTIATVVTVFGTVALIGRAGKVGFVPYDFQTATLMAMIMFGLLALLMCVQRAPAVLRGSVNFLASYSYSLYLIHNTVLIVVLEHVHTQNAWARVAIAVIAAHSCAYLLYLTFERHYRVVGLWLRPKFERALAPRGVPQPTIAAAAEIVAGGTAAATRQER